MSKIKRIPGSALERGQYIRLRKTSDAGTLAHHPENRDMVAWMYKRYRFEWVMELKFNPANGKYEPSKPTDEWVIVGQRGNAYEHGVGQLGITIVGSKRIGPLVRTIEAIPDHWLSVEQLGDQEANFSCDWTEENVQKVHEIVKFRVRRTNPNAKPPTRPTPSSPVTV